MFETTCSRCGTKITEQRHDHEVIILQWDMTAQWTRKHFCPACITAFWGWARMEPAVQAKVSDDRCPHGFSGTRCSVCGKPICNLCGLWAGNGSVYCATHKGVFMMQAH